MFRSNAISIATALLGTATAVLAQDNGTAELDLVRAVLAQLQPISIAENVEYCGYIGFDDEGTLTATKATQGDTGSCLADEPDDLAVIVASYHTHGGYSSDYFNEVPSADDIEGDEAEGIDGYVATPGGRLWYIDSEALTMSQICGLGCLPADPLFQPGADGLIAQSYSFDELIEKLDE